LSLGDPPETIIAWDGAWRITSATVALLQLHIGKAESTLIEIFSSHRDEVIKSTVSLGLSDYNYALRNFIPLLDRFEEQRKKQTKTFYSRLKKDIIAGCIMPPITIAFVRSNAAELASVADIMQFVNSRISEGYILDGLQRLNTLQDASQEEGFNGARPLYINLIIAETYDLLLYRMITLNNGQKPMTARHQIEMLTKGAIDLSGLSVPVVTEKETEGTRITGAFRKSDIVEAYTAYLTGGVNNQNSKIVETKLDEIIVGKVMDSDLSTEEHTFSEILQLVEKFYPSSYSRDWLRQANNLIGFTVGAKKSFDELNAWSVDEFEGYLQRFEQSFRTINTSKVNVGRYRRELSAFFIENAKDFFEKSVDDFEEAIFEKTSSD
jgi:hypothetical protein